MSILMTIPIPASGSDEDDEARLSWVGLIQSVEGLSTRKGLTLLQVMETTPTWLPWAWTSVFPAFRLELKHWLFPGLKPASY